LRAIDGLERKLGHSFARAELLVQSLTHRSFGAPHNERFEFLGDAMLNCAVAHLLFLRFPSLAEGDLSRLRANLVNQDTLSEIARDLQLGEVLRLGEGELKSGGFRRPSILADCLEAILGAIFLDAGFERTHAVIAGLYENRIAEIDIKASAKDPKTMLQEYLQAKRMALPKYQVLTISGEAHQQTFLVECEIADLGVKSQGSGASRRAAEQDAAADAYAKLSRE
jgi:ribonuclease III